MRVRTRQNVMFMAILITLPALLPGCVLPNGEDKLQPLRFTNVWITQGSPATADALNGYTGWISLCTKLLNPNNVDVKMRDGEEFYVVSGTGSAERLRLVQKDQTPPRVLYANSEQPSRIPTHFVRANETAESSGSTRYAIHVWVETIGMEPPLREDKWYNITYMPYASQDFEGNVSACF